MVLAPVLLELDVAIQAIAEGQVFDEGILLQKFAKVRDFLLQSEGLFLQVEETLFVDELGLQKLDLCTQEMAHSLQSLDRLQESAVSKKTMVLREKLQDFLSSRRRCLEYFQEFNGLAQQQPIYSPVPSYDSFVKSGIKVLKGQLDKQRLADKFPSLFPDLQKAQQSIGLLSKLHPIPTELEQALNQGLQGLQTGYGAIHRFLQKDDMAALEDGLKLLGSSSTILSAQLKKAEEMSKTESRYSRFRPLEEWLRLKAYLNDKPHDKSIPSTWINNTLSQVFYLWDFLLAQGQSVLNEPLLKDLSFENGVTQEILDDNFQQRERANVLVKQLMGPALLSSEDGVWLEFSPVIEKLQDSLEVSHRALEEQMMPFRELPGLENIVKMKEGVKTGSVSNEDFRTELESQIEKVEELIRSVGEQKDPVSRELRDLLPVHRGAFLGMLECLETEDWYSLDGLWQGMLTTLPNLAVLSQALRARVSAVTSTSLLISCLRCQAKNDPGRRVCSSCGASLPTVIQRTQSFSEIDLEEGKPQSETSSSSVTVTPRTLELLESLVEGQEQRRVKKEDAAEALTLLIDSLNNQRQMFSQKLLPLMGKEKDLDAYLRFFAQAMGRYLNSLVTLHTKVEAGAVQDLRASLSECRETLETMDQMKELIDGSLRG